MRTEPCVCGTTITAPSLAVSAPYIEGHNATPEHYAWRLRAGISRERPTVVLSCGPDPVGLVQGSAPVASGASAAAVRCVS
jgi:hypothetical protein